MTVLSPIRIIIFCTLLGGIFSCRHSSKGHDNITATDSTDLQKETVKAHAIDPDNALRYFSGNIPSTHNNPCVYIDKQGQELTVSAAGFYKKFSIHEEDSAMQAYRRLINDSLPETITTMNELLPPADEAKKVFGEEQYYLLYNMANSTGFEIFSGSTDGYFDRPLICSISDKLYLLAKGVNLEFEKKDLAIAMKELLATLATEK
jgi:hypothetical protein